MRSIGLGGILLGVRGILLGFRCALSGMGGILSGMGGILSGIGGGLSGKRVGGNLSAWVPFPISICGFICRLFDFVIGGFPLGRVWEP